MTKIEFRPYRSSDLQALQEIRKQAFAPVFASFRALVGDSIAATAFATAEAEQEKHLIEICQPESTSYVLVAVRDTEVVGFCSVTLDSDQKIGEIGLNAVHPDFTSRGIGSQMYEWALDHMRDNGMKVATVGTGADPSHAQARRAYLKAGFQHSVPSVWLFREL